MNTPTLKTDRLILRKFTENDIEAIYEIYSDKEVNKYLPWFPIKHINEAKSIFHEDYKKKYLKEQAYAYAICLKEDNYPIGYIKVSIGGANDFGYGLRKEFWNKGITTEAAKAVVKQLKLDGIPYITATHDRNNFYSGKVMKNINMEYKYSYEEQWQPKDILVTFRMYQLNLDGNDERVYKKYWEISSVKFIEEL